MKIFIRVISASLMMTIPLAVFCLGANVVTRMPDAYQYQFKATDALKQFDLNKSNDEMGEFISDFMLGKEKQFQIIGGDDDRPQEIFTENEMFAAVKARQYINVLGIVGTISLIITAVGFVMLKKYELDRELRWRVKIGTFAYTGVLIAYLAGFFIANKMGYSIGDMLGYVPGEDDMLPQLMNGELMKNLYVSVAAISTLIMALTWYGTYKLTEPKRIFSRN